jgi:hypothetical protein
MPAQLDEAQFLDNAMTAFRGTLVMELQRKLKSVAWKQLGQHKLYLPELRRLMFCLAALTCKARLSSA